MANQNQGIERDRVEDKAYQATGTTTTGSLSNRLVEQLGSLVERRERRKAAAAEEVVRQDRRMQSLAGAGAAFGFFGWLFWLMATFDSSRNAWFGAGFWAGLAVAFSTFVTAFVMRRRNVARIVEDVARDLAHMDGEIKNLKHRAVIANTGAGGIYRNMSRLLEPFVVKSRALAQVGCAAALIVLTGFGFLFWLTSQPPKAHVDRLAEYRANVGRTAYNATSGAEIGRIVGVEVTTMNGSEQAVYRIEREGGVVSSPVSNVMVSNAP